MTVAEREREGVQVVLDGRDALPNTGSGKGATIQSCSELAYPDFCTWEDPESREPVRTTLPIYRRCLNKCIITRQGLVRDLHRKRCEAYTEGKVSPFYLGVRTDLIPLLKVSV
ncbi:hypothetical protein EV356DRAFT_520476 [Viridothelium virens]|uniref:Uncharacterized protein n=1 Tax=Viridothelium virens TaxID=1048519 RepID=A0A6A6GWK7_VIRVR|nr:hypothetical protein EV356DRAFT_520476 [Viridothelium virens]